MDKKSLLIKTRNRRGDPVGLGAVEKKCLPRLYNEPGCRLTDILQGATVIVHKIYCSIKNFFVRLFVVYLFFYRFSTGSVVSGLAQNTIKTNNNKTLQPT